MTAEYYKISQREIDSVLSESPEKRFEYTIKRIADWETLWTIVDEAGALGMLTDEVQNVIFPIWPFKEFTQLYCTGDFANYTPMVIELSDFLEEYLPDYENKNYKLSLLPLPTKKGEVMDISLFREALNSELNKIE
ncbi:DUF2750 domain-containing protein [Chitinophaga oryziterrae]|uniref:DUF2750 domain-containing protein n=1 Tax=Chitinophaga oryziterrae TaxID=1031224 RepID=A0A6N8J199_9BACT|nr:DUF2750 domain-containing protein [Chitinophaga oryziterrae]MVT38950.1 DUF2750 domain-containing protein [Chitinophaga oryziterrae]